MKLRKAGTVEFHEVLFEKISKLEEQMNPNRQEKIQAEEIEEQLEVHPMYGSPSTGTYHWRGVHVATASVLRTLNGDVYSARIID